MLEHAFERYYETSGLFGRPDQCVEFVEKLKAIGVDDVACLIDFGVPTDLTLKSLEHLDAVRRMSNAGAEREAVAPASEAARSTVAAWRSLTEANGRRANAALATHGASSKTSPTAAAKPAGSMRLRSARASVMAADLARSNRRLYSPASQFREAP